MRRPIGLSLCAALLASLLVPGSAAFGVSGAGSSTTTTAALCAGGHGVVFLSGFAEPKYTPFPGFQTRTPTLFYWGPEGTSVKTTIKPTMSCSDSGGEIGRVKGHYTTEVPPGATATTGTDYIHTSGVTPTICEDQHGDDHPFAGCRDPVPKFAEVDIPLLTDGVQEANPTLEWFQFRLTQGEVDTTLGGNAAGGVRSPDRAPVYIADVNGTARATLLPGASTQSPTEMAESTVNRLHIPVLRAGPAGSGGNTVGFTVEGIDPFPATPGPAASGGDFLCHAVSVDGQGGVTGTAPCDYASSPGVALGTVNFGSSRIGWIRITVNPDSIGENPEHFRITLTEGGTLTPVEETFTSGWIRDNDGGPGGGGGGDLTPPRTRFHHPRQGKKYRYGAYQIREFHIFTSKDPSGVQWLQVALRRKMRNGNCGWWTGSRFVRGKCGAKKWIKAKYDRDLDWYLLRMPLLKPTAGTKVRNYTAWSRARDGNGNVEKAFDKGRNFNTFFINRRT